jgi:hypothetical protein
MADKPTDENSEQALSKDDIGPVETGARASFEQLAGEQDPGIVREFVDFLKYNKKWWLTPILLVTLLLIGAAILLPSPVAPFIYTLF